jgi:hypothetical protein
VNFTKNYIQIINKKRGGIIMNKKIKSFVLALGMVCVAGPAMAVNYVYVGSWYVDNGPYWAATDANGNYTTPVYSGVEAAAFLFGGSPSQYVTSTVSSNPADINFSAWMDGWADSYTYGTSGNPAPDTLHVDINNDGLYALPFQQDAAFSAYVSDHGLNLENFAFREVNSTPEPSTMLLLASGLAGIGFLRRKKRA